MLCAMTARHPYAPMRSRAVVEAGIPRTYRAVLASAWPMLRGWGRLRVAGAEDFPLSGPTLLLANRDSAWDPLVIGAAGRRHRRTVASQARALSSTHRPA